MINHQNEPFRYSHETAMSFTGPISLRSSVPILNLAAEKALLSF